MGNNSVPKFISRLSRFAVYRGSVLGRFYCNNQFDSILREEHRLRVFENKVDIECLLALRGTR